MSTKNPIYPSMRVVAILLGLVILASSARPIVPAHAATQMRTAAQTNPAHMTNVRIPSVVYDGVNSYYRGFSAYGYLEGNFSGNWWQWISANLATDVELRFTVELWREGLVFSPVETKTFTHRLRKNYDGTYRVYLGEIGETRTFTSQDAAGTSFRTLYHADLASTYSNSNRVYIKVRATLAIPFAFDEHTDWVESEHVDLRVIPGFSHGVFEGNTFYEGDSVPFQFQVCNNGSVNAPDAYFTITTSSPNITITGADAVINPPGLIWDRYSGQISTLYRFYEWHVSSIQGCRYIYGTITLTVPGSYWIQSRLTLNAPSPTGASQTYVGLFSSPASTLDQQGWYSDRDSFTVQPCYSLTTSVSPSGSGSVSVSPSPNCNGRYRTGTTVQLTANPASGYTFSNWSGSVTGTSNPVSLTMSGNRSITANFSLPDQSLTVSKTGTGSGTVTSSPTGINCGTDCSESYAYGTSVTLFASPASSSTFAGWSGACSGTGSCTVSMTQARSVTANFSQVCYSLTTSVGPSGTGSVSVSPSPNCGSGYTPGTTVQLTANPASGYTFSNWSGSVTGTSNPVSLTMSGNRSVTANFLANQTLTVGKTGTGSGTVTSNPSGINCGNDCTESYAYGTTVTLAASPAAGSTFTGWSGACSGTGSCTVSMTQARSVTASFNQICYSLSTSVSPSGAGSVSVSPSPNCGSGYTPGTTVQLTANPASGYTFSNWSGSVTGTSNPISLMMSGNRSVTANFTGQSGYLLTISKTGTGSGTVTSSPAGINCGTDCSETYAYGTSVTLSASPASGSTFAGWSGACSGTGNCTVSMTQARSVTASFSLSCYVLTTYVSPSGTGSVSVSPSPNCGSGYTPGTTVQLTANPASGYTFSNWNGALSGSSNPVSLLMDGHKSVTASFNSSVDLLPPDLIAPADGSMTSDNTPTFDWSASTGANQYRLQVDNNADFSSPVIDTTTSNTIYTPPSSLAEGTYYWHVRADDGAGNWSSYSSVWDFTIEDQPIAVPPISSNIQASDGSFTDRVRITWGSVSEATSYEVYRATSAGGVRSRVGTPAGASFDDSSASPGTIYYYWVKACNSAGCSGFSAYNTGWRNRPPHLPNSPLPSDGATVTGMPLILQWSGGDPDSSDFVHYDVYLDINDSTPQTLLCDEVTTTSCEPGILELDDDTTFYWRVVARDSHGATSNGPVWYFTAPDVTPPPIPALIAPANGTTTADRTPSFSWHSSEDATRYWFQLDDNANFSSPVFVVSVVNTAYTVPYSLTNGTFYWRVQARDEVGNLSEWSETWHLNVGTSQSLNYRIFLPGLWR